MKIPMNLQFFAEEEITDLSDFELLPDGFEDGMDIEDLEALEDEEFEDETDEDTEEEDSDSTEPSDGTDEEEEDAEEVESDEDEDDEDDSDTPSLEDLDIKFLHETKKLKDFSPEVVQTTFQKGLNYDRIQAKLTESQDSIKEIAEMYSLSTDQLLDNLKEQYFKHKAEDENRNINDVRNEFNANRKSSLDKMIDRFVEAYPNLNVDELPEAVMELAKGGAELTDAYSSHMKDETIKAKDNEIATLNDKIAQLEKTVKVTKQNTERKKKGVVKKTSGSDSTKTDDFLEGFFG